MRAGTAERDGRGAAGDTGQGRGPKGRFAVPRKAAEGGDGPGRAAAAPVFDARSAASSAHRWSRSRRTQGGVGWGGVLETDPKLWGPAAGPVLMCIRECGLEI